MWIIIFDIYNLLWDHKEHHIPSERDPRSIKSKYTITQYESLKKKKEKKKLQK